MDLVKIGFLIKADGLVKANKEIDALLAKADKLNNLGGAGGGTGSGSGGKQRNQNKPAKEIDKTTKALEKQKIIGDYVSQGLDKSTATTLANFKQLGASTKDLNKMFAQLGNIKSLEQANKAVKDLAKAQKQAQKDIEKQEKAIESTRQKRLSAEQKEYQKTQEDAKKSQQKQQDLANKAQQNADNLRQKTLAAEQKYYQKVQEEARKAAAKQQELSNKNVASAEAARQKSLSSAQKEYQKNMELIQKQQQAQRAAQQKADEAQEKARQKKLSAEQKYYQQQQELAAKAARVQQDSINRQNQQRQNAVKQEETKAKYLGQGFSQTASTKLARMELSGADVATMERYKQALRDTAKAMNDMRPPAAAATEGNNRLLASIRGIAAYALLSTAIYGVITGVAALAKSMVTMADEYTSTQQRLKLYIKDAQTLAEVNQFLAKSAIQNNIGLRENAALYAKLAPAMQRIGANTAATNQIVDAFGKSLRIGGATAMEAASATIQFAQAMASGKLAGDEFRSISEASPRFLKAIADGSGYAAEKLKEMSAAGKLTTEVIARALVKEYHNLVRESESLGYTLEQGTNAIKTGFMSLIGEFNEGAGITKYLGSLMADLGVDMINGAEGAKTSGEAFKAWAANIRDEAGVAIDVLLLGIKTLTALLLGRMTAALVATMRQLAVTTAQTIALRVAMSSATASALGLSVAMRTLAIAGGLVKGVFGGWIGFVATLASVAIGYNMFKTSASEANDKLVEQSKYISMTKEELSALDEQQRKMAKFKVEIDLREANKNIQEAKDNYNELLDSWSFVTKNRVNSFDPEFVKQLDEIRVKLDDGSASLDETTQRLVDIGAISLEDAAAFNKMSDEFDKTVKPGVMLARVAKDLGINIDLSTTAAQGSINVQKLMQDELKKTAEMANIAGSSVNKLADDFNKSAVETDVALQIMKATNLEEQRARKLSAGAQTNFEKAKLLLRPGAKVTDFLDKEATQAALKDQQSSKNMSDYQESLKPKKTKKEDINNLPEQLAFAQQYLNLIRQGIDLDVAKIAATKEYSKWYGNNLAMAYKMAAVDKQRADIEKQIQEAEQSRATKDQGLKDVVKDLEKMKTISKFVSEGFTPSVAAKAAGLGFVANAEGVLYAQKATTLTLEEQVGALRDSAIEKRNIFELTKSGKTVEQAQIDNLLYTNSHLLPEQITLLEQIKELQVVDRRADTLQKVVADSNTMLREAAIYAAMQNNELGGVAVSFDMINKSEVQHLNSWKDIVQAVKDYNDYLVNQKANPLGDFSNINFDVFGDFGNPFQSALEGLNLLLGGADALKEKYDQRYATLDQQMKDAAGNQKALDRIEITRETLKKKEVIDQTKLKQDQVSAALKGVKTLFKEESKGYKALTTMEQVQQGIRIALAIEEAAVKIGLVETTTLATMAANAKQQISEGVTAAISSMKGLPFPYNIAAMGATIAAIAGLGVAIGGGSSSGSFAPTNEGTGTVFGDTTAKSESIKKSIDLLADNSDVTLPLTASMLKSLQNIESNIGGLANLLIRNAPAEGLAASIGQGFKMDGIGKGITGAFDWVKKLTFGLADVFTFGLFSAFGKMLGGAFGKKVSIKGQGLSGSDQELGGILSDGFSLQEYVDVQTKKKSFGITTSKKNSTQYSEASAELSNQFTLIFKGFNDAILATAPSLGKSTSEVTQKLNNFVVSIGKISLKDLNGEQIQEKLEAVFGAEADKMAQAAVGGLEDFQKVGEGYFETIVRVATGVEQAKVYTDRLNVVTVKYNNLLNKQGDVATEIVRQSVLLDEGTRKVSNGFYDLVSTFNGSASEITNFVITLRELQDAIFATGKNGDYLTSSMFAGAGSLDRLSSGLDAYFEMLSPAEQATELTRRLTNEFAIFGKQLPSDVKAFRNLVSSIDISSEAGQKLYGQILALAPEFNDLQDALSSANSDVNALVKSLRDLAEQARAARGETEQPRNLAYTRSQFEQASVLAMQGDIASAEKLLTLGKDLMGLSKTYSVSGSEYARDLALIQRAATVSADIQEQGLGTSISTTLTPSSVSTTTPTVNTNTTSTDAKLDSLREDLNTALLAIAKYTQNTSDRLDRWDDGDRMRVHVEQDVNDIPIPVKVVV